jgi:hypothetical protein
MMRTSVFFDCVNRVRDGLFDHEPVPREAVPERIEPY